MPRKPAAEYDIKAKDGSAEGWRQALKTADSAGKKLTGIMKTAFAGVSLAAITGAIKASFEFGDEIGKAAVKAGIGTKAMSELSFAARMADIDLGSLSTAIRKMQTELSKASTGGKEQKEALDALGLSISDLKQLQPDEQFEVIGDAISRLRDPMDRARAATVLFGRAGADLLPLFAEGMEGIRKARDEAAKFGHSLSEDAVKALQQGDDAIKKLSAAWDGFMAKVAVWTIPLLTALDLIDKDKVGELQDELARVNNELLRVPRSAELGGTPLDPETYDRLTQRAQALERQIANLNDTYTRGGGSRRGRGQQTAPGFKPAGGTAEFSSNDFDKLMEGADLRRNIQDAAEWRALIDDIDKNTNKSFIESNEAVADSLLDINEPILKLSDSLIQADELQKEFTRSMFDNVSEALLSLGDGADNFADSMLNAFKKILADRATLELFNMLSGLGGSLTSSSGGNGISGAIGSFLTSTFGGGKAKGGPLDQGKWYMAGEHGPEPIWGGGAGAFAMGYGGGVSINAPLNIDARGATKDGVQELIRGMPQVREQWIREAESRIVRRLKGGAYS